MKLSSQSPSTLFAFTPSQPVSSPDTAEQTQLSVLHIARSVGRRSFGVGVAALSLTEALRAQGMRADNWSTDTPSELRSISPTLLASANVRGLGHLGSERFAYSPRMFHTTNHQEATCYSLLHQHGLWSACSIYANRWRKTFQRPTVITPHGALDAWAVRKSRAKKWLALHLFERANLQSAACLHALNLKELEACRRFGISGPVAVIPNGVSESWLASHGNDERFRDQFAIPPDKRILLFLSRVTPKKGLPALLHAVAELRTRFDDWLLLIAGPDEFGHVAQLKRLARDLQILPHVKFAGPLYGHQRRDAFAAADVFILPSISEGQPIVVLEALGARVPAIVTSSANCDYIADGENGWQSEATSDSLKATLSLALECSPEKLSQMGDFGHELMKNRFTWEKAAQNLLELYQWVCGQAVCPKFVAVV